MKIAFLVATAIAVVAMFAVRQPTTMTLRSDPPVAKDLITAVVVADHELSSASDRRQILKEIFNRLAAEGTHQEKVIRITAFLQEYMFHPKFPPVDSQGTAVFDPMWMLSTRLGQCGQTNRLLADILSAGGYDTRIVQLNGHITTEVNYDGEWHWLDADALDGGRVVLNERGRIASAMEITLNPSLLDGIEGYAEIKTYPENYLDEPWDLKKVFVRTRYAPDGPLTPFVYIKTATPQQEADKYYGWTHYKTLPMD